MSWLQIVHVIWYTSVLRADKSKRYTPHPSPCLNPEEERKLQTTKRRLSYLEHKTHRIETSLGTMKMMYFLDFVYRIADNI